jgi:hypothetical protein
MFRFLSPSYALAVGNASVANPVLVVVLEAKEDHSIAEVA